MSKEHIKKLFLGGIGLLVLLYVYFTFFMGPLNASRAGTEAKIAEVQGKTASSKAELAKTARLEENARAAVARNKDLRALSPEGAPIAWFPPRIRTFLNSQQIDKAAVRLEANTPPKEKELEKWGRYAWIVDIPQAEFETLGRAVAGLENAEPLLAITRLRIGPGPSATTEFQQVSLSTSVLIDQK